MLQRKQCEYTIDMTLEGQLVYKQACWATYRHINERQYCKGSHFTGIPVPNRMTHCIWTWPPRVFVPLRRQAKAGVQRHLQAESFELCKNKPGWRRIVRRFTPSQVSVNVVSLTLFEAN